MVRMFRVTAPSLYGTQISKRLEMNVYMRLSSVSLRLMIDYLSRPDFG